MLHTKFRGNWPAGSGAEDFLGFLPYMGVVAILVRHVKFSTKKNAGQCLRRLAFTMQFSHALRTHDIYITVNKKNQFKGMV